MPHSRDKGPGSRPGPKQLELPLQGRKPPEAPPAPGERPAPPARTLRVIEGGRQRRKETLETRNDVARLLVAAAADMLLHRITSDRAHEIQVRVERVQRLFERCQGDPILLPILRRELDELEALWRESQDKRRSRR